MNVAAWSQELCDDADRDFLLSGVKHGFHIIDPNAPLPQAYQRNHKSALEKNSTTSSLIQKEIDCGNYVAVSELPRIVSPLGLVPKSDGGDRLIHDCSMPRDGRSVNDFTVQCDKQSYESIDDAVDLIKHGYYMAKVDIKSAYRSVAIHPSSYAATGLQWTMNGQLLTLVDTRMPFGARPSPNVFHRLSQAVKRMMARHGHGKIIAYQDDFLVIGETYNECLEAWVKLIQLLMHLGFQINYKKLDAPSTDIVFLGIRIDSMSMQLSLPPDKLQKVKDCLLAFKQRQRATKR